MRIATIVSLIVMAFTSTAQAASLNRVLILRPDKEHPFWNLFESASRAACEDLGCTVESTLADWNQVKMVSDLETRLKQQPTPDLVIFQSFKRNGPDLIRLCEKYKANAFLVNADLDEAQAKEMGNPREKYSHWVGRIMPDDAFGGKLMAEYLYAQAQKKGLTADGKLRISAIEGNMADGASIERVKGLRAFLSEHPEVELTQIVQGKWLTDLSATLTQNLAKRYPDVRAIWSAGDTTAMGVIAGTKAMKKLPGKDIITVGLDWSVDGLQAVKNGELEATVGGHFMEGAWAIVATYDFINGVDFAKNEGVNMHSAMALINQDNVAHYLEKYSTGDFSSVDFTRYSKVKNPDVKKYNLDFSAALK